MDQGQILEIVNQALISMAIVALPILIPAMLTGITVSLFQAVTQISEQTLTFVPKIFVLIICFLISGPWIFRFISNYAIKIIERVPEISLPAN